MSMDDDFVWHIRLEGDAAARRAGEGAHQKAAEEAASTSGFVRFLRRLLGVHDEEHAWRKGAEGERAVGRRLDRLERDGWTVIHDLTVGSRGANIDHLVIGPGGVFVINTKNHLGKRVWGRRTSR